jgi:sugar phosphate isomerase/epimerase
VTLALGNHADLDAAERRAAALELVADDRLRICFDTANALRRGDDVLAAAARRAEAIVVVT